MARKKQFKAESQRLLDLVIHSIYTNQEIFLRELISNASDALDKLLSVSLDNDEISFDKDKQKIIIRINEALRTISIIDNGIGMDADDLEKNLGTIAHSGTLAFKEALAKDKDNNISQQIGQFGVGFYSAFMVAKEVKVLTKKVGSQQAYVFTSDGVDGYTIDLVDKADHGTEIILFLREQDEDHPTDQYLDEFTIKQLIKKYSDYITYPIVMYNKDNEEEVVNSQIPLWKKSKTELSAEDYDNFYMNHFNDFQKPLKTIHFNVEGALSFTALLFIPSQVPYNFYSEQYQKGLQLYSQGVFILDHNTNLIADHFGFVKGIVDSSDLSLNISRELLQNDRQLHLIANRINRKVKTELEALLKNEREEYEKFYRQFGQVLKYGIYQNFGQHKDELKDLVLFYSSFEDKLVSLAEYESRMKEEQKEIYTISAASINQAKLNPAVEKLLDDGYEILFLLDHMDEFVLNILHEYNGKHFKVVNQGDVTLDEQQQAKLDALNKEHENLLTQMKDILGDKINEVKISARLKSQPVCLVSKEGVSLEMEKVLAQNPDKNAHIKAEKVLELNATHPLFERLEKAGKEDLALYSRVLYNQARLIEGLPIEDAVAFSNDLAEIMIKSN